MPAADEYFWTRVRSLDLRGSHTSYRDPPALVGDGRLSFDGRWISLSPMEERLLGPLVAQFTRMVTTDVMREAGWPDGEGTSGALRIHVTRLRKTLTSLGLELAVVRHRGYVLQPRRG